jgi:hypothetical protein
MSKFGLQRSKFVLNSVQICSALLATLVCHPQARDQQAFFRWREADMPRLQPSPTGAYIRGHSANPARSTDPRPTVSCLSSPIAYHC